MRLIQLILSLSILVVIHEFGHFIFSKLSGVRVEKFYMFFNPQISLVRIKKVNGKLRVKFFSRNVPESYTEEKVTNAEGKEEIKYTPIDLSTLPADDWRQDPDNTEFGIGWIPFGGYCKIAGMIDESNDQAALQQEPKPWEFRTKPAWKRFFIMVGGVMFNLLLAFLLYSVILLKWGDSYIPATELAHGLEFNDHAKSIGFRDGDIILSTDGNPVLKFDADLFREIAKATQVTVLRDGREVVVDIPEELSLFDFTREEPFVTIYSPMVVDSVVANGAARLAGITPGDTILRLNNQPAYTWSKFQTTLGRIKEEAGTDYYHPLETVVAHANGTTDTLTVCVESDFILGIVHFTNEYSYKELTYNAWTSIPAGIAYGWNTLTTYVSDFRYVFTKEGAKSLGGFGTIGSLFPQKWNWHSFWLMTAFLSVILAFMNILPIPGLDGAYVLFLLIEVITGRKPGDKFIEKANSIGMVLLFMLLIYANLNDLLRALHIGF